MKKKLINNSHNMKSSKNINIKLRLNNQNLFGFIPSIKKAFVKNNKILNSNDKSRSKYEEKTELIHHVKKIYKKKFEKNNEKDNIKDIIKTENVYKNEIKKNGKIFFKLDKKISKDHDINASINNRIKFIKYNKNLNSIKKKFYDN